MIDALPPHDDTAERCIIGSCLLAPKECVPEAQTVITGLDYFYTAACQDSWIAICALPLDKVDIVKVSQKVPLQFLNECQDLVPSAANLPAWLEIIVEKYLQRKLIAAGTKIIADAYETRNPIGLLDEVERDILAIRPNQNSSSDIKALVHEAINKFEHKIQSGDAITGLPTGIADLDRLTDGLHGGEMIVVAALPSRGKSALAVNIAVHNAIQGTCCVIFTAETMPVQVVVRSLCAEARINFRKLAVSDIPAATVAASKIAKAPLHVENANGFTIGQVRAISRRLHQKHPLKLIVIDYIQILRGIGETHEQEISSISKGLKSLAMELNLPVLVLSQITETGGKFKTKYASAISEDADSLWRLENDGEWQPLIQPIKLNVEKSRDGETGTLDLTFFKKFTRIEQASKVSDADIPER